MYIALGFAPAEISVQLILIAFVKGVAELRKRGDHDISMLCW